MSNISAREADFAHFESQFSRPAAIEATPGQSRVRGWMIVLGASVVLWTLIGVGISIAIHAVNH